MAYGNFRRIKEISTKLKKQINFRLQNTKKRFSIRWNHFILTGWDRIKETINALIGSIRL